MTRSCSVPDCDRRHKGRGLCELHLQRLRRTGTTDSPVKSLADRFWSKVNRNGPVLIVELGQCWVWTAATNDRGYGVIRPEGRRHGPGAKAHRVSLELAGVDIEGRNVRHRCDNPPCVNPAHLVPGSQADNVADMVSRGRIARGSRRSNLTDGDVLKIRRRATSGELHRVIATDYGVARSTITRIVNRTDWGHVA